MKNESDQEIMQNALQSTGRYFFNRDESMANLTVRLTDFEAALLEDLVHQTGESKTALVVNGLRTLANMLHEDQRSIRLSAEDFDSFLKKLEDPGSAPGFLSVKEVATHAEPSREV